MISSKAVKLVSGFRKFLIADKSLWFRFRKYQTWITRFTIDGKEYGGWYDATGDIRLKQFEKAFPVRAAILEMGSLEGGHTFNLARMPGVKKVVALEGRDYNIRKSEFVRGLLKVPNVEFHLADLEKEKLEKYGAFDVCFSLGLLYHLPEPWIHLSEISKVTKNIFLWTHYADPAKINGQRNGYPGWIYQEYGFQDPLSGLSDTSYWPSLDGLKKMLADAGFPNIEIIEDNFGHKDGPAVTLSAKASA
jgi:SAM-dependent methyltransferase